MDVEFGVNVALTLIVGLAIWATVQRFSPAPWTATQIIGVAFLLEICALKIARTKPAD
jgi:hypothetical protein